ncbi:uncharacterized protein LOC124409127 [Diprion similis]|uniref:uncharacterized protein LOC124409127 n=1 Tax=Diprion similis TaxID=362088 RepID=UPI001EF8D454|nr:uncharacterized protein LOC124409127 [Diprion similis]
MIISCRLCSALIALCFTSLVVVDSLAELVVVRAPNEYHNGLFKVTCISEYDDRSLSWIKESGILQYFDYKVDEEFQPNRTYCTEGSDDIIADQTRCLYIWNAAPKWKLTSSVGELMKSTFDNTCTGSMEQTTELLEVPLASARVWGKPRNIKLEMNKNRLNCSEKGTLNTPIDSVQNKPGKEMCQKSIIENLNARQLIDKYSVDSRLLPRHMELMLFDHFEWLIHRRIKFHHTYFLSTENNVSIEKKFDNPDHTLCLYFLVNLCSNCSLQIKFFDDKNILKHHFIGPFKDSKALSWRWEILNVTLDSISKSPITVVMTTQMNGTGEGRWATRFFRTCQSRGLAQCLRGNGPFCIFDRTHSCNGTIICNPSGCTCPAGCKGANCTEECTEGYYGYNCQNTCDQCDQRKCSKISGLCFSGCKQHYVGRYCETRLEHPYIEESTILTAVKLNFFTSLKDVDDRNFSVQIKNHYESWRPIHMDPNFSGEIELCIKNLEPKVRYEVRVTLNKTESPAKNFNIPINSCNGNEATSCDTNFAKKLSIERDENSIKLTFPSIRNGTKSYIVLLSNHSTVSSSIFPVWTEVIKTSEDCRKDACMYDFQQHENSDSIIIGLNDACLVRPDATYLVRVFFRDSLSTVCACGKTMVEKFQSVYMLVIIPLVIAGMITAAVLYVLYRKFYSDLLTDHTSVSMSQLVNEPFSTHNKSDDSSFGDTAYPERLKKFEYDVRRAAEDGKLQLQYNLLPKGLRHPCEYGRLPQNKGKNRYRKLIAYDKTRVMLAADHGSCHSIYINANYIPGYAKQNAYIATQAPTTETMDDFWKMIWQEEVHVICMLVDLMENGKKMCEQYWPDVGGVMEYGEIVVSNLTQDVFADYTYRTFNVTKHRETEMRKIEHLQYTTWPEQGVPTYSHSVIEYLRKMLSVPLRQGPIVVHCSSGTGRTGTIILSDIVLRNLAAEGTVDVFAQAKIMYDARANMLESFSQYVMAHLVPIQCLLLLPTAVWCRDITPEKINEMKKEIPALMIRLKECAWMDKAMRPLEPLRPPLPENLKKNRFPKLTPVGPSLVTLQKCPLNDNTSDYISAVSIDGVKTKKQYIASQLPLPTTRSDLWMLIVENNIELIVILQRPNPKDESCCNVIPERTSVIIPLPYVKVENTSSLATEGCFTVDDLLLTDNSGHPATTKKITVLTCNDWSTEAGASPPPPKALVDLWQTSERIVRPEGPTLVLCYDGLTGCGLYLAMSFMLERMKVEQDCDVILAVHAVRRSRKKFVTAQRQFEYLYDAALEFNESFKIYDNLS